MGANLRKSFGKPTACWDSIYKNTVEAPIYRHAPRVKRELHVGWNVQRGRYQPGMLQGWMRTEHEVPGRLGEGDLPAWWLDVVSVRGRGIKHASKFLSQTAGQMLGLLLDIGRVGWELGSGFSWVPLPTSTSIVISWGCWHLGSILKPCGVPYLFLLWSQKTLLG